MIQLPVTGPTPVLFYTASMVGLHAFFIRHVSDNQFIVKRNGNLVTTVSTPGQVSMGMFYLEPGDTLTANADGDSQENLPSTGDIALAWVGDGLV